MATPVSVTEKTMVLAQLERILASPAFRNSKRHSNLLRHLVERTLDGGAAELKERNLGVDVFGRPAGYDNYVDPVVRISAGEVRKRIAQYYHEPGREKELRIELPLGSYVPDFPSGPAVVAEPVPLPPEPPVLAIVPAPVCSRRLLWALLGIALLAAPFAWWRPWTPPAPFELFWRPYLDELSPPTICVARAPVLRPGANGARPNLIAWPDSSTAARLAGILGAAGQRYLLESDVNVTFDDLRRAPAILIGAFNDVWTIRLTESLRFEFQQNDGAFWISDRQNPSSRAWSLAVAAPGAAELPPANRDYAVISRLLTTRTGKPVLTIAGIRGHGTLIAGEFVSNHASLQAMAAQAPAGWWNKNLQVVIETEVIDGHPGPPRILAVHSW